MSYKKVSYFEVAQLYFGMFLNFGLLFDFSLFPLRDNVPTDDITE